MMLGILKSFTSPVAKILLGVLAALVVVLGLLWWRYDVVSAHLTISQAEIVSVERQLETSEQSIKTLQRDFAVQALLLKDKESARLLSQSLANSLSKKFTKELQGNEKLQECTAIDMREYVDGVLKFPAHAGSYSGTIPDTADGTPPSLPDSVD
jgi:hypothetical protein